MAVPLVSVMIVARDAQRTLPAALVSVLAQTFRDWECIVVDDGSRDGTLAIAEALSDARVRLCHFAVSRGRGAARDHALQLVNGSFVAFLDADDWAYPDRLERQLAVLEAEPDVAAVAAGMAVVEGTNLLGVLLPRQVHSDRMLRVPPFPFAPLMVRTVDARRIGFNPRLERSEDVQFVTHLVRSADWAALPEPLYTYRFWNMSKHDLVRSHVCAARAYATHGPTAPVAAANLACVALTKGLVHQLLPAKLSQTVARRARLRAMRGATNVERDAYHRAACRVRGGAVQHLHPATDSLP